VNRKLNDDPGLRSLELNVTGAEVDFQVCTTWSSLVTRTVEPAAIVMLVGLKAKFLIVSVTVTCGAVVGGEVVRTVVGGVVRGVVLGGKVRAGGAAVGGGGADGDGSARDVGDVLLLVTAGRVAAALATG
jgi:hypothetical protein